MPVLSCPFRALAEQGIAKNRRAFGALNVFGRLKPCGRLARASRKRRRCDLPHLHARHKTSRSIARPRRASRPPRCRSVKRSTSGAREMLLILLGITGF